MTYGPIYPCSAVPITTDRVFDYVYAGASSSGVKYENLMGVQASVGADATWALMYEMPGTIPSGTLKLRLRARANTATNSAKVNPKWVAVAMGAAPDAATVVAEGTNTLTWAASDNDKYKELKISLVATTLPTAGQILVMNLVFETSGWTLNVISGWHAPLIWE
jgi:hypothetical protein